MQATFLPLPYHDSFPVTVAPSTPPFPHSVSVQYPGDFPDTPRPIASSLTLSHPPDGKKAIATPYEELDITQISSTKSPTLSLTLVLPYKQARNQPALPLP